jgi:hypothetical protein
MMCGCDGLGWGCGRSIGVDCGGVCVPGPKSGYGASREGAAYDQPTGEQSQFGLQGKTGYGQEGSDPQLGQTDPNAYGAVDPNASSFDNSPTSNTETIPGGEGWGAEDTCMW